MRVQAHRAPPRASVSAYGPRILQRLRPRTSAAASAPLQFSVQRWSQGALAQSASSGPISEQLNLRPAPLPSATTKTAGDTLADGRRGAPRQPPQQRQQQTVLTNGSLALPFTSGAAIGGRRSGAGGQAGQVRSADDVPSTSGRTVTSPSARTRRAKYVGSRDTDLRRGWSPPRCRSPEADMEALIQAITAASTQPNRLASLQVPSAARLESSLTSPWTAEALLEALDAVLPEAGAPGTAGWPSAGRLGLEGSAADVQLQSASCGSNGGLSHLLPVVVAPAWILNPPSSSLRWTARASEVTDSVVDNSWAHTAQILEGPAVEPKTGQWHDQQEQQQQQQHVLLMGPLAVQGPAVVGLMCGAAGVALPSWVAVQHSGLASASLALDPALEWALGILSDRVTPSEPAPGALRLANCTLAAHVGRASWSRRQHRRQQQQGWHQQGTAGGSYSDSSLNQGTLPWPLLVPLLDAIGSRLNSDAALALLQGLTRQVTGNWRERHPPRELSHLMATFKALFSIALRRPDLVTPATAAGLLVNMSRLRLHSPPTCAVLVGRILAASQCGADGVLPPRAGARRAVRSGKRGTPPRFAGRHSQRAEGRSAPAIRLEWAAVALSSLSRLRVAPTALPRRAATQLLWCALASGRRWTPALAAGLLVSLARLSCRPSVVLLRRYSYLLLQHRFSKAKGRGILAARPVPDILVSRMTGLQLVAILEALSALYHPHTAVTATGNNQGMPVRLACAVAAALVRRLDQVPRQQLCRLPVLLQRLDLPQRYQPQWLKALAPRAAQMLPDCDAVDVVFLLRGLAIASTASPGSGKQSLHGAWLTSQLADSILRRYVVLVSSASLQHTAAVLQCLAAMQLHTPFATGAGPSPAGSAAGAPTTEAELGQRQQADLASEREFFLQQLDEHLVVCLAASSSEEEDAALPGARGFLPCRARLIVKALLAYCRLECRPSARLQAALEATLVDQAQVLGTVGWSRVREAYSGLGLQAGRDLSVALVTFG